MFVLVGIIVFLGYFLLKQNTIIAEVVYTFTDQVSEGEPTDEDISLMLKEFDQEIQQTSNQTKPDDPWLFNSVDGHKAELTDAVKDHVVNSMMKLNEEFTFALYLDGNLYFLPHYHYEYRLEFITQINAGASYPQARGYIEKLYQNDRKRKETDSK